MRFIHPRWCKAYRSSLKVYCSSLKALIVYKVQAQKIMPHRSIKPAAKVYGVCVIAHVFSSRLAYREPMITSTALFTQHHPTDLFILASEGAVFYTL